MDRKKEERLKAFETMYQAVKTEYDSVVQKMEILKADGRTNSATYREMMGRKIMYVSMLDLYKIYDLD